MSHFNSWDVGIVINGKKITKIFSLRKDEFIVYAIDDSGDIFFDSDKELGKLKSRIDDSWADAYNLLVGKKERLKYQSDFASALRHCLMGEVDVANIKLKKIRELVIDYKNKIGRMQYFAGILSSSFIAIIILTIASQIIMWQYQLCHVIIFGLLGGLLSSALSINSLQLDVKNGSFYIHFFVGAVRSIIPIITSTVAYYLIKGDFILGFTEDSNDAIFYVYGAMAGFSETFIPNILNSPKQ